MHSVVTRSRELIFSMERIENLDVIWGLRNIMSDIVGHKNKWMAYYRHPIDSE